MVLNEVSNAVKHGAKLQCANELSFTGRAAREVTHTREPMANRFGMITQVTSEMDTAAGSVAVCPVLIWEAMRCMRRVDREAGHKKTDALHIPVVNIETPPLEINLQRKASSLLRNVNRASVCYR